MSFLFEVAGGTTIELPTAGKYCDRNILVAGKGYTAADLTAKYDRGRADGIDAGAAICAAKHFAHSFVGDGTPSVSFYCPFEPDAVQVIGFDPLASDTQDALMLFCFDNRAFGMPGGFTMKANPASNAITYFSMGTKRIPERYSRTQDGVVTIHDVGKTGDTVIFAEGFVYTVVLVKYTEQTDAERIAAFVDRLSGSGTVTLNQAKVTAAYTDDEWAALIAAKPNWTFVLS